MALSGRTPIIAIAVVIVVVALMSSLTLLPAGSTANGPGKSASGTSIDGLKLTLELSSTSIHAGGSVTINVTEANTRTTPLNESAARTWPLRDLRMNACYSSIYPFGVAVYRGHYTTENVSAAAPLNLYPLLPCPLLIRYISGYYFSPNSDMAAVLPGSGSPVPMTAGVAAAGNYTSGSTRSGFAPGEYTVAAGDEWGSLLLLYFSVK